jgi:hypothetical protein
MFVKVFGDVNMSSSDYKLLYERSLNSIEYWNESISSLYWNKVDQNDGKLLENTNICYNCIDRFIIDKNGHEVDQIIFDYKLLWYVLMFVDIWYQFIKGRKLLG